MDLNIGSALWLAVQAEGRLRLYRPSSATGALPSGAHAQVAGRAAEGPDPCQHQRSSTAACPTAQQSARSALGLMPRLHPQHVPFQSAMFFRSHFDPVLCRAVLLKM